MDWALSIPIIVALVGALAGFGGWLAQRRAEVADNKRLRKETLYNDLLEAIVVWIATGNNAALVMGYQHAWMYASDEVFEGLAHVVSVFSSKTGQEVRQRALGKLQLAMRRDLLSRTGISDEWMEENWTFVSVSPEQLQEYLSRGKTELAPESPK